MINLTGTLPDGHTPDLTITRKELKRYIVYPVVFNRRTGNVHFFSIHDGQPVTYPWRQCIYCVVPKRNGGPEGSYYELRGYVLNKRHGGVMDSFSIGEEAINVGRSMGGFIERWFSCHYEYVRAFMTLDSIDGLDAPSEEDYICLLYTSPSPRDRTRSRMPSSA